MGKSKVFRRFKELLKKIWAKKIIKTRTANIPNHTITNKKISRVAHTTQSCGCEMCGNTYHHSGSNKDQLTIQEIKKLDNFKYYDDTYYDEENPI